MGLLESNRRFRQIRALRTGPGPDVSIARQIDDLTRHIAAAGRTEAALVDAWASVAPAELARHAQPVSLRAGTLMIKVTDAAAQYAVDRWLRGGGQMALAKAMKRTVRKSKLVM